MTIGGVRVRRTFNACVRTFVSFIFSLGIILVFVLVGQYVLGRNGWNELFGYRE